IGFLGGLHRMLTEEEQGRLENIDILLLPVGGAGHLTAKQAVETIQIVEPRIVIPLGHHVEGVKEKLGSADAFCKELGVCKRQDSNKLKISKKDLPAEDLLVAVLERA
ncbi:MBL fold metallo-hydrolase, partial [Candidatus Uhrbacteria bacterium]|nr:MBL fold metallo-hydrolase [Candidatus Uhrbacteria bacterium]